MRKIVFFVSAMVFIGILFGCSQSKNSPLSTNLNQEVSLSDVKEALKNNKRKIPNDKQCLDLSILSAKFAAEGAIQNAFKESIEVTGITEPKKNNPFSGIDSKTKREEVYLPVTFVAQIRIPYEGISNYRTAILNVSANFYENARGQFAYNIENVDVFDLQMHYQ